MSLKIQIIIAIVIVVAFILVINMIRKKRLDMRHALPWLIVGFLVLILDVFPSIVGGLSKLMGIELPINMLFFLGFCFSLLILFSQTITISNLSDKVKKLTQELALLEKKNEEEQDKQ